MSTAEETLLGGPVEVGASGGGVDDEVEVCFEVEQALPGDAEHAAERERERETADPRRRSPVAAAGGDKGERADSDGVDHGSGQEGQIALSAPDAVQRVEPRLGDEVVEASPDPEPGRQVEPSRGE